MGRLTIEQAIEYWKTFWDEIDELRHTPGTDPEEWDEQENATAAALEALVKQRHYEDLEEQGRLITLPCPINTELYFVGEKADGTYGTHSTTLFTLDLCKSFEGQIGKGFYLTREEAIAKLKELEGDKE